LIAETAARGTLRRIALGGPPVKLLRRLLAVSSAAGLGMTSGCRRVSPGVLICGFLSVSRSQHDLEFIQLIPLGIGPLSVRDRQKRLQPLPRGNRSRFIHGDTISLFDEASLDEFREYDAFQLAAPRAPRGAGRCIVTNCSVTHHCSTFTPASLITFDQLAISARMKAPNSSGVVGDGSL
jgi:hypothetical protein